MSLYNFGHKKNFTTWCAANWGC